MLKCDVCGKGVRHGSGYCLSTAQVTAEPEYWRFRFVNNPEQVALIGKDGAHLHAFAIETSASVTVWLVCDGCIGMFRVDREKARTLCLTLSRDPSRFRGDTQLGPGYFEAADEAAQEGWRKAFGKEPTLQMGDPALMTAMAAYALAKAKYERCQEICGSSGGDVNSTAGEKLGHAEPDIRSGGDGLLNREARGRIRISEVAVFVGDTTSWVPVSQRALRTGGLVLRNPPECLMALADEDLGLHGELLAFYGDRVHDMEYVGAKTDADWHDFILSRFPSQRVECSRRVTNASEYVVVVVFAD